jgi:hypothetical protein
MGPLIRREVEQGMVPPSKPSQAGSGCSPPPGRSPRTRSALLLIAVLALFTAPADARDYREPFYSYDPLARPVPQPGVLTDSAAEIQYMNYLFKDTDLEIFLVNTHGSFMPVTYPGVGALSLSFGSYLLAGRPTMQPNPHAAGFLLNVIQFEYSLRGSVACGPLNCLFGYGRLSQHRLHGGLQNTGEDILSAGVSLPPSPFYRLANGHALTVRGFLLGRNKELYDFWQSTLPEPRSRWTVELRALVGLPLSGSIALFTDLSAEALALRDGGSSVDWMARLGARGLQERTRTSLYLYAYRSEDTRLKADRPTSALLIGIGGQLVIGATMW